MHDIFKSVYLQQIKVTDSCSAFQNLSKKYIYMSQCEMGVQVNKYPQYNTTRSRLHPERGTIIDSSGSFQKYFNSSWSVL